jgi:hypothetical protein
VRDRTATKAEVEAAFEMAYEEFSRAKRLGFLKKAAAEPDVVFRYFVHDAISRFPDEVLPPSLRDYICSALSEEPKGKRTYAGSRNLRIIQVVYLVMDRGFDPTRNDATRTKERCGEPVNQSACSIVAKALRRVGVRLDERSVEDIYLRGPGKLG